MTHRAIAPEGFVSTDEQIHELERTVNLALSRPITPDSEIALRSLLILVGMELDGTVGFVRSGGTTSAQAKSAARARIRQFYTDLHIARVRVVAEGEMWAERNRQRSRWFWAIRAWRRVKRWAKELNER